MEAIAGDVVECEFDDEQNDRDAYRVGKKRRMRRMRKGYGRSH